MKDKLKNIALKYNIEYSGLVSGDFGGYNTAFVCLLPYYCGNSDSYFSKYTRGKDYHKVGREILEKILSESGIEDFEIYVDVSPFNERELALKAGLGVRGKNGLVINEKYGSYVFIAIGLLNTSEFYNDCEVKECLNCGMCLKVCPAKAITEDRINYDICISAITQKRQITDEEALIIKENKTAWGCDICQDACPMNKHTVETPIREFKENLLLYMDDIDLLSNKDFIKKYGYYSLAYKGKKILKRNLDLQNDNHIKKAVLSKN